MEVKERMEKVKQYSEEFKKQAIELAEEIGAKEASEKLGLRNFQVISSWKRFLKPEVERQASHDLASALEEIKRLKKELVYERRSVGILKEAAAFFSKEILK